MARDHRIEITAERWKDKDLVQRIKSQARMHAGNNPGVTVTVYRELEVMQPVTHYKPLGRGKAKCGNCWKPWHKHTKGECPNRSYWEVVWRFVNYSRQVQDWK